MKANMLDWSNLNEGAKRLKFDLKLSETTLMIAEEEEIDI